MKNLNNFKRKVKITMNKNKSDFRFSINDANNLITEIEYEINRLNLELLNLNKLHTDLIKEKRIQIVKIDGSNF